MPHYLALTYTEDVHSTAPEQAATLAEYRQFGEENRDTIRSAAVLHPTATATRGPRGRRTWRRCGDGRRTVCRNQRSAHGLLRHRCRRPGRGSKDRRSHSGRMGRSGRTRPVITWA